jgi:HD-GYP domain-containing protein (c-di-GMP phosphodiesterase class II)
MAILPDTSENAAVRLCERLRQRLDEQPFITQDGERIPLRMSIGVASYPVDARRVNELIALADSSLYSSKQRGGDSITTATAPEDDAKSPGGMFGVLDGLVNAVDTKDKYTRHHSEDVTHIALQIARQMVLSPESQGALRIAGLLHDVGKIGIPDRILRKPAG